MQVDINRKPGTVQIKEVDGCTALEANTSDFAIKGNTSISSTICFSYSSFIYP